MTTRGRTPKPEEQRAGHRKGAGEADAIEVSPVESRLVGADPPQDMAPLAAEVWTICIADMAKLGHLREPDLITLRGYCEQFAVMVEDAACIQEFGAMMKEPILAWSQELGANEMVGWKLKPNPAVKQHREALNTLRLVGNELGLSPLARIRGNLMQAATASIALGIRDEIAAGVKAEDAALAAKRQPRKKKS